MLRFTKTVCVIAVLTSTSAFADIETGLMAKYTFDNCDATDHSGNNNNGTFSGNISCVDGIKSKGINFNGAGYITVPHSASLVPQNKLTISFWIKIDEFSNDWNALIYKGAEGGSCWDYRSYAVWTYNSGSYFHQTSAGDGSCEHATQSKSVALKGTWIHYVGVIDRANHTSSIYINGKLSGKTSDSYSTFFDGSHDLKIGGTGQGLAWESPVKGIMDEVRLYNRNLTAAEIATLYNQGVAIGGTVTSMGTHTVTCTNTTTKQVVNISATKKKIFDCESSGLKYSPGDKVTITVSGTAE